MDSMPNVLVVEQGSQTTLLISRCLRELGRRSVVMSPKQASVFLKSSEPKLIILSGGVSSVYDKDALQPPDEVVQMLKAPVSPVAILGICYGMQIIAQKLGGEVRPSPASREYGAAEIWREGVNHPMFSGMEEKLQVWMNHGDSVMEAPRGYRSLAFTDMGAIAAMAKDNIWAVQFHPEVTHTPCGKDLLENCLESAGCERDWERSSQIFSIQSSVMSEVQDDYAVIGMSGGVDSTTEAAILSKVLGKKLLGVTIDGGHLREGELDEIETNVSAAGVEQWTVIDARAEFQAVMFDTTDAEEKRRRFKHVYTQIFRNFVQDFRENRPKFVIQGTLAPDKIESGATGGAVIKSHHNIGLDMGELIQLHPMDHLFKYEVRELAKEIGLPESVWNRQPFPGPGLFLRVNGVPATPDKLEIVRWANARVAEVLIRHGLYDDISQLVVSYNGTKTVGVKGEGRVYGGSIVVRAIQTTDFMTAKGMWFPEKVVDDIKRVLSPHPGFVRVLFDPTDKPPATTEPE